MQAGDKFRLKSTHTLKKYGMRCHCNFWQPGVEDNKLWPGDVGTVRIYQGNGWQGMCLDFERGRSISIGTLFSDSTEWEIDQDKMENFKEVRSTSFAKSKPLDGKES